MAPGGEGAQDADSRHGGSLQCQLYITEIIACYSRRPTGPLTALRMALRRSESYQRRPRYCGDEGISLTQASRNSVIGGRTSADCSWSSLR